MKYTEKEVLDELIREHRKRCSFYPKLVKKDPNDAQHITQEVADHRIGITQQLIDEYRFRADPESLFHEQFQFSSWLTKNGFSLIGSDNGHALPDDGSFRFRSKNDWVDIRVWEFGDSGEWFMDVSFSLVIFRPPMSGIPLPQNDTQAKMYLSHIMRELPETT